MGIYVLLNLAAIAGAAEHLQAPWTWVFALLTAAPIAAQIWAMLVWMRDSDEFVRGVAARRFIAGAGLALAFSSTWGFLEAYAGAPSFPVLLLVPFFYGAMGLSAAFIRSTV